MHTAILTATNSHRPVSSKKTTRRQGLLIDIRNIPGTQLNSTSNQLSPDIRLHNTNKSFHQCRNNRVTVTIENPAPCYRPFTMRHKHSQSLTILSNNPVFSNLSNLSNALNRIVDSNSRPFMY